MYWKIIELAFAALAGIVAAVFYFGGLEARVKTLEATSEQKAALTEQVDPKLSALPSSAVVPFDLRKCPAGWEEYRPAYGRFIRGLDPLGETDPMRNRTPGSVQDDAVERHSHPRPRGVHGSRKGAGDSGSFQQGQFFDYSHVDTPSTGLNEGDIETRPKNVALLFCIKL